jgi:hypothetical protein
MIGISLVSRGRHKHIADDICTYATRAETCISEYLTGKASQEWLVNDVIFTLATELRLRNDEYLNGLQ